VHTYLSRLNDPPRIPAHDSLFGSSILPVLLSRMEQGRRFLRERVDGASGVRLELVARPARQSPGSCPGQLNATPPADAIQR
jgi:hypothetical protein